MVAVINPDALSSQIRSRLPRLQPAMRRVAEVILRDPAGAAAMSISSLAHEADTSEATVSRLCRELGVRGYAQLRLNLAGEAGARVRGAHDFAESTDIAAGDDLARVVEKIAYGDCRSVTDTAEFLSISVLARVAELLVAAPRVEIFGVGASGIVAMDLQQKLHRIGLISHAHSDPHQGAVSAALLSPGCVAIGISHSGATLDTVQAVRIAVEHGATAVALTDVEGSVITEIADFVLLTMAWETRFRAGATGSRLAQMALVDYLFIAVAQCSSTTSIPALTDTRAAVRGRSQKQPEIVPLTGV